MISTGSVGEKNQSGPTWVGSNIFEKFCESKRFIYFIFIFLVVKKQPEISEFLFKKTTVNMPRKTILRWT